MIKTNKLQFSYNDSTTFSFPDFECEPAQTLLITGQSGTGKTTLLHILAGLQKSSEGQIFIGGIDISKLSSTKLDTFRGKNIGLILQNSHFIEALNVLENLELTSWLASGNKNSALALDLLNILGLEDKKNKFTTELSIGQQQRVSIARALMVSPKVILADEPTSSLDDFHTEIVSDLLQSLAVKYKASLIIVTHDARLKQKFNKQINLI